MLLAELFSIFCRQLGSKIRLTFLLHLKQVVQPEPEVSEKTEQRDKSEAEDESERATEEKTEAEGPDAPLVPVSEPGHRQGSALIVTDSWRLANKSLVVTEISLPPSQESSSDSVFTDPEELAAGTEAARKKETSSVTVSTSTEPIASAAAKSQRRESTSFSPRLSE